MAENALIIKLGGATQAMHLAVEISGFPHNSSEWIITAEPLNRTETVTPDQINWFYSDAVNRSFVYVPEEYRGGLLKTKELVTTAKFDRVRLSISSVPWAKHGLAETEYPELVRCKYAASNVLVGTQNTPSEPMHLLGEVTR